MVRTSETACSYNQGKHLLKPDSPTNKYSQIHAGTVTSLLKMKKERIRDGTQEAIDLMRAVGHCKDLSFRFK